MPRQLFNAGVYRAVRPSMGLTLSCEMRLAASRPYRSSQDATSTSRTLFGVSSTLPPRYRQATLISCSGSGTGMARVSMRCQEGRSRGLGGREPVQPGRAPDGQAAHKWIVAHEGLSLVKLVEEDERGVDACQVAARAGRHRSRVGSRQRREPATRQTACLLTYLCTASWMWRRVDSRRAGAQAGLSTSAVLTCSGGALYR